MLAKLKQVQKVQKVFAKAVSFKPSRKGRGVRGINEVVIVFRNGLGFHVSATDGRMGVNFTAAKAETVSEILAWPESEIEAIGSGKEDRLVISIRDWAKVEDESDYRIVSNEQIRQVMAQDQRLAQVVPFYGSVSAAYLIRCLEWVEAMDGLIFPGRKLDEAVRVSNGRQITVVTMRPNNAVYAWAVLMGHLDQDHKDRDAEIDKYWEMVVRDQNAQKEKKDTGSA